MRDPGKVLILGAGPTGLGAAWRLHEAGATDFSVLEARQTPGGLASSYVDDQGYTWDVGGHVQFSHYSYYDDVLDRSVQCGWLEHERESWVWLLGRWVPYPFQNNIHRLPAPVAARALRGLERAQQQRPAARPANFREWIEQTSGAGIAETFLFPYNRKVWGYPPETMDVGWIGERVAVPDLERIRRNLRENRDDVSWGPNKTFRFPARGGTGMIWRSVAALLPDERLRYGSRVVSVDAAQRRVRLDSGEHLTFDHLVSSLPLDRLGRMCSSAVPEVARLCRELVYSSVHILGIGLRGDRPEALRRKCWMYFPESHSPYYRVTVFSNYSRANAPPGPGHWSLMAEVCESPHSPVDEGDLERWTLEALRRDELIGEATEVKSFWHRREEHGYPTPFLGRDRVVDAILPLLERQRIYSRGRFGAWKYEVSNQDHSFMQGVEVANRLLGLGDEPTLERPSWVNEGAFLKERTAAEGG